MVDLQTPEGVATYMWHAHDAESWNDRCDDVKNAHGGDYPAFWFPTVVMSGLASEVSRRWRDEPRHDRRAGRTKS